MLEGTYNFHKDIAEAQMWPYTQALFHRQTQQYIAFLKVQLRHHQLRYSTEHFRIIHNEADYCFQYMEHEGCLNLFAKIPLCQETFERYRIIVIRIFVPRSA